MNFMLIVLAIVLGSFLFLGFNIFFRKKSFPETEIGRNREMRKLGLACPKGEEKRLYGKSKPTVKINPEDLTIAPAPGVGEKMH